MRRISRVVQELLEGNELLLQGLYHRLLNLSQVARFIKPQVEARAGRQLELSAVTMALSRLQRELIVQQKSSVAKPAVASMTVHSNLLICVFPILPDIRENLNRLYSRVREEQGYITITEGISEASVITSMKAAGLIDEFFPSQARYRFESVSSLAIKFQPTFFETAGVFYFLVQQLYFQNINILEMASAGTEFILYLEEEDVRLAFDTIYRSMSLERVED